MTSYDHAVRDCADQANLTGCEHATLLVFDLDGTLFDSDGCDYESADSVRRHTRPHPTAIALVQHAYRDGHGVAYLTGRCEHIRPLTQLQLDGAGLPPGELVMNQRWEGYEAMSTYKARALERLRAHLYVGDHDADEVAARRAGVPFHHANDWRRGIVPEHMREGLTIFACPVGLQPIDCLLQHATTSHEAA